MYHKQFVNLEINVLYENMNFLKKISVNIISKKNFLLLFQFKPSYPNGNDFLIETASNNMPAIFGYTTTLVNRK